MGSSIIITPSEGSFYVGFESIQQTSKVETLSQARFIKAFYEHLNSTYKFKDVFVINNISPNNESYTFNITATTVGNETKTFHVHIRDFEKELDLENFAHLSFKSVSTSPQTAEDRRNAIKQGDFKDGFTLAATSYFEINRPKVSEVTQEWNTFTPQSRLVVQEGQVVLTKRGLSRFEQFFYRFFNPETYQTYMEQNSKTIQAYQDFLEREVGKAKIALIEATFGFSFEKMKQEGHPLLPVHVYYFNIGMNNVDMEDVERFANKFQLAKCSYQAENHSEMRALDYLQNLESPFTMREARGMLAFAENPENVTLGELMERFDSTSFFNRCVEAVMTPRKDWEGVYTGCKFNATIKGSYNGDVDDQKTKRFNIDMQELAQVHHEILDVPHDDPRAPRIFNEYLAKIAAKKHLMHSSADGETWRVGSLIPSPFKDEKGERIWYRVDQGVDSAHGKLWYVFKPADDHYDEKYPIYRVLRDTCRCSYAQRGGPTISRDVAHNAGYMYSNATEVEDREFFDQFTLPVWMGHLLVARKSQDPEDELNALRKVFDPFLVEKGDRLLRQGLSPKEIEKIKQFKKLTEAFFKNPSGNRNEIYRFLFRQASLKDLSLFNDLLIGKKPRPVFSVGNSLGGFDAQYDVVKQTALRHRIPIVDLSLYTHSTLKIRKTDDDIFTEFITDNAGVLDALDVTLRFDHITEEGDIVSMFGQDRTFLGHQLQEDSLRVFKPIKASKSSQIHELGTHIRRVEHLKEEEDIDWKSYSVSEYESYSAKKRLAALPLDWWHTIGDALGLFFLTDSIWRADRYFNSKDDQISRENRCHKLVVKYKDSHRFKPIPKEHLMLEAHPHIRPEIDYLYERLGLLAPYKAL